MEESDRDRWPTHDPETDKLETSFVETMTELSDNSLCPARDYQPEVYPS